MYEFTLDNSKQLFLIEILPSFTSLKKIEVLRVGVNLFIKGTEVLHPVCSFLLLEL